MAQTLKSLALQVAENSLFGAVMNDRRVLTHQNTTIRWPHYVTPTLNASEEDEVETVCRVQVAIVEAHSLSAIPVQTVADHAQQQACLIEVIDSEARKKGFKLDKQFLLLVNQEHDKGEAMCAIDNGGAGCDVSSFAKQDADDRQEHTHYLENVYEPLCRLGHENLARARYKAFMLQWAAKRQSGQVVPPAETSSELYDELWQTYRREAVMWRWIECLGYVMDAWCDWYSLRDEHTDRRLVHPVSNYWGDLEWQPQWEYAERDFANSLLFADSGPMQVIDQICKSLIEEHGYSFFSDDNAFTSGRYVRD